MKKTLLFLTLFFPVLLSAQSLDFEALAPKSNLPAGWQRSSPLIAGIDSVTKRSGNFSLRIAGGNNTQSHVLATGLLSFAGDTVCLSGYIKANNLAGSPKIFFSLLSTPNIDNQIVNKDFAITRSTDGYWVPFELKSALCSEVTHFSILCFINGVGEIWLDDLSLTIDGKPLSQATPKPVAKIEYKASLDKQFDGGSGFSLPQQLTSAQVENLNALARVWGLLKYYHPAVARGDYNWDYELLRMMPKVYTVDAKARNKMLLEWVESLGPFDMDKNNPNKGVDWVGDTKRFGAQLSKILTDVSVSKRLPFHYYFRTGAAGCVPVFCNEATYADMDYNDAGMRLLGVFRLWNAIEYFYPYRYMTDDRDKMLSGALLDMSSPKVNDKYEYLFVVNRLLYGIHDSHGGVYEPTGAINNRLFCYAAPFVTDALVEGRFIVKHAFGKPGEDNVQKYDAITHIDGKSVADIVEKYKYFFHASNRNKLEQLIARTIPYMGNKENVTYTVERAGSMVEVRAKAYPLSEWGRLAMQYKNDFPTPTKATHKIYADSIAYISLSISGNDLRKIAKEYLSYPKIVIDSRETCEDEEAFDILTALLPGCLPVARYLYTDPARPGNFIAPAGSGEYYAGSNNHRNRVVVVVDHNTQSYMEYSTMMLQNIPGMITLGNQTSGADGTVTSIPLPGEVTVVFTSLDWHYPDGSRCQGVGVRIDEVVTPTLKGIREGRDELLERAIELAKQRK